ncbi:MAG TPA: hypothetical protein VHR72_09785 [Gemmataceae bacterium]|nr:hypothetical protein [Gemmataceae bacterium]
MSADPKGMPPSDPFDDVPPDDKGWWLRIFTPEESERMLREEPRIPIEQFMAELERKYGYHFDA